MKKIPVNGSYILVVEDAIKEEQNQQIRQQYELHKDEAEIQCKNQDYYHYKRWYPLNKKHNKWVAAITKQFMQNRNYQEFMNDVQDGSWRRWNPMCSYHYEIMYTMYRPGEQYGWHVDNSATQAMRVLSWILYLNDDFEGGETQIANETITKRDPYERADFHTVALTIKPKRNMLVMFPTWMPHQVTKVLSDKERITLNGHVS